MKKRFELVGITKNTIIHQGLTYFPEKRVCLIVNESDKNFYSQFMVVENVRELLENKVVISEVENFTKDIVTVEKQKPTPKPKSIFTTQTRKKTTTNKTKK